MHHYSVYCVMIISYDFKSSCKSCVCFSTCLVILSIVDIAPELDLQAKTTQLCLRPDAQILHLFSCSFTVDLLSNIFLAVQINPSVHVRIEEKEELER